MGNLDTGSNYAYHTLAYLPAGHSLFASCNNIYTRTLRREICKRTLIVIGLTSPEHIVSCSANQCLYALDWVYRGLSCEILRIDSYNGKVVKNWETCEGGGRLSVGSDTNVIFNIDKRAQLNEYTADGDFLRMINLTSGTNIVRAWHSLKLDSGLFVVCHDKWRRICLLSIKDSSELAQHRFDTEVLTTFGGECEHRMNVVFLRCPMYLAVDKDGLILVCDSIAKRILVLNSCLEKQRDLAPNENTVLSPWRVCIDESKGRYLVAENKRILSCKKLSDGNLDWRTLLG